MCLLLSLVIIAIIIVTVCIIYTYVHRRKKEKYCSVTGEPHCKCMEYNSMTYNGTRSETLRKLWTDHAIYTKFVITDILQNLGNTNSDLNRLLRNQQDIGLYVGEYIGPQKGNKLSTLLTEHIKLAGVCLTSLKDNKPTMVSDIDNLFSNADKVGSFFSSISPYLWSKKDAIQMFHKHNQYVLDIATSQKNRKYEDVVKLFDAYYNHMLMLSDKLDSILQK